MNTQIDRFQVTLCYWTAWEIGRMAYGMPAEAVLRAATKTAEQTGRQLPAVLRDWFATWEGRR